ncbi:VOC family protein [Halomonas elongata]|uniref:VOC family protein n=1 Tax=Halomonas elongata TaxID=2746 RepID=UPI00186B977E|nr:VOC family protein [Halomonas elongata]MBW5799936.1 VOC family protein [Halomonas elongata]
MHMNAYLMFDGDCETAMTFYAECFGGRIEAMERYGNGPQCDGEMSLDPEKIMHVRLVADGWMLMGSDCPPAYMKTPQGFSVAVHVEDIEEAERLFSVLSAGGQVEMPLQQTHWAIRFGMLVDRFGTPWMINCEAAG